jgi:hypothetical protein
MPSSPAEVIVSQIWGDAGIQTGCISPTPGHPLPQRRFLVRVLSAASDWLLCPPSLQRLIIVSGWSWKPS